MLEMPIKASGPLFALMRGRELKSARDRGRSEGGSVRPHARAGVEMGDAGTDGLSRTVRPHARAGVEIYAVILAVSAWSVRPHARAGVEMLTSSSV